jgi:hypothetical protein
MAELMVKATLVEVLPIDRSNEKYPYGKIVVSMTENGYTNFAEFVMKGKQLEYYDKLRIGSDVEVKFNLKGRSYIDKKTGVTKYFCSNEAWFVKQEQGAKSNAMESARPQETFVASNVDDNDPLPF